VDEEPGGEGPLKPSSPSPPGDPEPEEELRAEANRKGLDLTALVLKLTSGYLTDFGLPQAATTLLDEDRAALGMDRDVYLLHLLFQRSLAVRDEGPGFDVPKGTKKGR